MARTPSQIHRSRQPVVPGTISHAVIHRGRAHILPKGEVPGVPEISQFVTVSWAWTDQPAGNISWTFVNSDQNDSHAVVLYRNNYIFGGAFWPIYLGPDDTVSHMLDGTQPIPTLTGTGGQPMGIFGLWPDCITQILSALHFQSCARSDLEHTGGWLYKGYRSYRGCLLRADGQYFRYLLCGL